MTTSFDSDPIPLDAADRKRRMSDRKIQEWANSALLKLLQFVFTLILLPLGVWALNNVTTRLASIETSINAQDKAGIAIDARFKAIDRELTRLDALSGEVRALNERVAQQNFEIQRLREIMQQQRR